MAADLAFLSLSQLQKSSQSQVNQESPSNPSSTAAAGGGVVSWMWNPNQAIGATSQEEDDSWEVRAFAEDTGNAMGTTWPPRSYTCSFCRREFRSAQALGGHMNVHRRDRARLHQAQPNSKNPNISSASSTLLIPTQELVANGGLCLLYSLPNPSALFHPSNFNNFTDNTSTLHHISPHPTGDNLLNFPIAVAPHSIDSSLCNSSNTEASASTNNNENELVPNDNKRKKKNKDLAVEEIDLELRLGRSSPSPS